MITFLHGVKAIILETKEIVSYLLKDRVLLILHLFASVLYFVQ